MARAFADHHQIVCSIMEHKGDNTYLSNKGGLSFGLRKLYVSVIEGNGVVLVVAPHETLEDTTQGNFLINRTARKLKYTPPSLDMLNLAKLKPPMVIRLEQLMDKSAMTEEERASWDNLYLDAITEIDTETEGEDRDNDSSSEENDSGNGTETESEEDTDTDDTPLVEAVQI